MPPKDTQAHELFYSTDGGETMKPLGKVTEVPDLSGTCIHGEDGYEMMVVSPQDLEMTFTATGMLSKNLILFLFGDKHMIPNNWLKMHGIPMRRKRR